MKTRGSKKEVLKKKEEKKPEKANEEKEMRLSKEDQHRHGILRRNRIS